MCIRHSQGIGWAVTPKSHFSHLEKVDGGAKAKRSSGETTPSIPVIRAAGNVKPSAKMLGANSSVHPMKAPDSVAKGNQLSDILRFGHLRPNVILECQLNKLAQSMHQAFVYTLYFVGHNPPIKFVLSSSPSFDAHLPAEGIIA